MGSIKQGVLGGFSGKAGTVIGYARNGIASLLMVLRILYKK